MATPIEAVKRTRKAVRRPGIDEARDPLADALGDRHGAFPAGVGQDQGEFVAAEPGHDVGFAGAAADDRRRLDERLAAGQVPVAVVDAS